MVINLKLGLNILKKVINKGLDEFKSDKVITVSFNVNLDYVLSIFDKYPKLHKFIIYANKENIIHSGKNTEKILEFLNQGKIEIHTITENKNIIHIKGYGFYKENVCKLLAVGSPNLSRISNQNIESLVIFSELENDHPILKIWEKLEEISEELKVIEPEPRALIFKDDQVLLERFNEELLDGLWEHQKAIVKWIAQKTRSIVNIPPGTGKTRIAIIILKYLLKLNSRISIIILVPTKILISQWEKILTGNGFKVIIGGSQRYSLESYIAKPEGTILLTLYKRFSKHHGYLAKKLNILSPQLFLIADECQNIYSKFQDLLDFTDTIDQENYYHLGLSATIDTFEIKKKMDYISYCGGLNSVFDISLQAFYANWNNRNSRPILKGIIYKPIFYYLTENEYQKYVKLSRAVYREQNQKNIEWELLFSAAIRRAHFVRSCEGALSILESSLVNNINDFNIGNVIIFVFTNANANRLRNFLTSYHDWDPDNSVYIYDSKQHKNYLNYAMKQFTNKKGFCLISERMLSEGFDLPKVSHIILHGSHKSERDWIQKIGRAIRYDPETPEILAQIIDVVFCDPKGRVLPIEKERYEILSSLSNN